jgi:CheY-like chemotaxis protein
MTLTAQVGLIKDCFKGWTILLVEDDDDAMIIARRWFRLAGAEILMAGNGHIGLEMARQHQPTLIISDLHMPVMDGWQFCEALKSDETTRHIPVIALSADQTPQTVQHSLDCGFVGFIRKPLDPHKFVSELLEAISAVPHLAVQQALMVRSEQAPGSDLP